MRRNNLLYGHGIQRRVRLASPQECALDQLNVLNSINRQAELAISVDFVNARPGSTTDCSLIDEEIGAFTLPILRMDIHAEPGTWWHEGLYLNINSVQVAFDTADETQTTGWIQLLGLQIITGSRPIIYPVG
jgi:hypothetical protein